MAATSPPTRPPAAAGFILTPSPVPSRVSVTFGCRRRASPRRRPPRCSRGGKPAVKGVVQDETSPEPKPKTENGSEEESQKVSRMLGWLRLDSVAVEILSIAVPTVLALAADPITALVDTAFVGHIGKSLSPTVQIVAFSGIQQLNFAPKWCLQTAKLYSQVLVLCSRNLQNYIHPPPSNICRL
jgi:hypothetical protein